jgi:endo-1,4-beta-xylanase
VTLENNGKWENVEPNRDQMNWGPIQAAYDYCKKNKIPYKHHTFLWNEQYPKSWFDKLSAADKKAEVEELIKEFGQKFPETAMIDVANECREKSPSWKDALGGAGTTGYDWLVWAYEMARKYCPNSKLLINEYFCEYSLEYVTDYLKIIKVLKEKNLLDGIGIQTHDAETKKGYTMGTLKKCIDSLATSGLPIYSTELDLAGNDSEQLDWYQKIFPIIWEHPAMYGVTLWGWTNSWLMDLKPPRDARLYPNNTERPALKWLRTYVAEHKKTIPDKVATFQIVPPAVQERIQYELIGNVLHLKNSDTQPLTLQVVDPAGRIVWSQPKQTYTAGVHTIAIPGSTAAVYRILTVQDGNGAHMIGNVTF